VERKSGGSRKKRVTGDASGGGVFRRGAAVNPKAGKPVGKPVTFRDLTVYRYIFRTMSYETFLQCFRFMKESVWVKNITV
jgi:hypothetical protein